MAKKLQRGRIAWMEVIDPQNNSCGEHGVIILTPDQDINAATTLIGVVISSELGRADAEMQVNLPWDRRQGGHLATGLWKKSAAICNWLVRVKKSNVQPENMGGMVPAKYLLPIVKKVAELAPPAINVP